jgi:hypothetical protein
MGSNEIAPFRTRRTVFPGHPTGSETAPYLRTFGKTFGKTGEPSGVSRRFQTVTRRLTPLGSPKSSFFPNALSGKGYETWAEPFLTLLDLLK